MTVADRVREALRRRGWTAYRLAKESGVSQPTISRVLGGHRANLSGETVAALARTLGVRAEWILTGEGHMVQPPPVMGRIQERREWSEVEQATLVAHPELDPVQVASVGHLIDDPALFPTVLDVPFVHGFAVVMRDASARAARKKT